MQVTKQVHIDTLKIGDAVIHDGKTRTVGKENLKKLNGIGTTLYGDSYRLGQLPVAKVCFPQFYKGKLI